MNLRPLPPQGSALPAAPHPDLYDPHIISRKCFLVKYFFEKIYKNLLFGELAHKLRLFCAIVVLLLNICMRERGRAPRVSYVSSWFYGAGRAYNLSVCVYATSDIIIMMISPDICIYIYMNATIAEPVAIYISLVHRGEIDNMAICGRIYDISL